MEPDLGGTRNKNPGVGRVQSDCGTRILDSLEIFLANRQETDERKAVLQ